MSKTHNALIGKELFQSLRSFKTIPPITTTYPEISIDDAYEISKSFLDLRIAEGEKLIGKKIGVTSKVVQEMLSVNQPDFGFLTDAMYLENKASCSISKYLIQPRAEAEIAFILDDDLHGPGISKADVINATKCIKPCFEIVDSRIVDWNINIEDTIADNASCGVFCLGDESLSPIGIELDLIEAKVFKNNNLISSGLGSAVQGHPAEAVAWLANTLGKYEIPLLKDEIILSGSLVPLEPACPGDKFRMELSGLGSCEINFVS